MQIKIDDVFSLSSGKYIALTDELYMQERYIFTNKLDVNEEPTNEFKVFKCVGDSIVEEKDKAKLEVLLKRFSEKVNEKLELINDFYLNKGENNETSI